MAGENNIAVVITAQTGDLTAKMALAQAAVRDFGAQQRQAAEDIRSTLDPSDKQFAALNGTSAAYAAAKGQLSGYQASLKSASAALHEAAAANEGFSLSTTRSRTELIVLAHEMIQGRFRRIPGSIMVMTEGMRGLGSVISSITPLMYGGAAAAAALAAGMVAVAVGAARSNEALGIASRAFQFAGLDESRAQLSQWTEAVRALPGVSAEAAGKIVAEWTKVRDATPALVTAMIRALPAMGDDEKSIAEANTRLVNSFDDLGGAGQKFLRSMTSNMDTVNQFNRAVAAGDRGQAMAILLAQLAQNASHVTDNLGRAALAARSFGASLMLGFAGAAGGEEQLQKISDALDASKVKDFTDAMDKAMASPTSTPQVAPSMANMEAQAAAIRQQVGVSNAKMAQEEVSFWEAQLATAEKYGTEVEAVSAKLAEARASAAKSDQSGAPSQLDQFRTQLAEMQADFTGTHTAMLAESAKMWQQESQLASLSAKDKESAEREYANAVKALHQSETEDAKHAAAEATQAYEANIRTILRLYDQQTAAASRVAEEGKRAAQEDARAWNSAFEVVDRSATSVLNDLITRHEKVGLAAQQAVSKLVLSWVDGLAEIMLKLAAFEALKLASGIGGPIGGMASSGASALGGSLAKTFGPSLSGMLGLGGGGGGASQLPNSASDAGAQSVQQLQTAILGNTTATAMNSTGITGWIQQSIQSIAQFLGLTTATTVNTTALAANTAALSASAGASGASAGGSLFGAAAGGAGLFGGLSFLFGGGAAAGAGAGAGAADAVGLVALATGAWSLPRDTIAQVHAGEMVLPADVAQQARATGSIAPFKSSAGGSASGSSGAPAAPGGVTVNVSSNSINPQAGAQYLNSPQLLRSMTRSMQRYMQMNPSIEPA